MVRGNSRVSMGARFRTARRALGLTQQQVAENLCDRSYVSLFEQDKVSPNADLVIQLANRVQISVEELLNLDRSSTRTRSQLLYIDDVVARGRIDTALEYMEQLWWDATVSHDMATVYELYERVQKLIQSGTVDEDSSWPTSMVMWLLTQDRREWAVNLGYQLQQRLFAQGKWQSAVHWGKTLLRISPPAELRIRIGVGTASALLRQGDLYQAERQYVDVLDWIPSRRGSPAPLATAWVHHGLSAVYGETNAWQKAHASAQKASAVYQHLRSPKYWLAMQNIGIIQGRLGNRRQALDILSKCNDYWAQVNNAFRVKDVQRDIELI